MSNAGKWVLIGIAAVVCIIQPELEIGVVIAAMYTLFSGGKKK